MWQFAEAVRGLADGCQQLGIPVTGGNVSFYNQTGAAAIHPTPVVGVLGIFDDVARRVPMGFAPPVGEGDVLFLLGETSCELSGSEWAWVTHGHLGGRPPRVDLVREQRLGALMARASQAGHLGSAHDLSDGGLAQALAESCLRRNVGAKVALPDDGSTPFVFLFSESASRVLVSIPLGHEKAFAALAADYGVPCTAIGVTSHEHVLEVRGEFVVPLDELRAAWSATLPRLFGGAAELANRHGDPEGAAEPQSPPLATPEAAAEPAPATDAEAEPETTDDAESARSVTLELSEPKTAEPHDDEPDEPDDPIEPESPAEPAAAAAASADEADDEADEEEDDGEVADEDAGDPEKPQA